MSKQTQALSNEMAQLAEDAHALVNATAGVAEEKVGEARIRLAAALERGREIYGRARGRAIEGVHAADEVIHEHSFEVIAVGIGVGMIVGYLLSRQCNRNHACPIN